MNKLEWENYRLINYYLSGTGNMFFFAKDLEKV